jgi:hypothetical protein
MRRTIIPFIAVVAVAVMASVSATPATAKPRGINGKIVTNSDNLVTGEEQVYTVDPDATNQQLVYNNSEVGQWSPDGTRIALVTQLGPPQVLLFNVDDGAPCISGCRSTSTRIWRSSARCGHRTAPGLRARAKARRIRA